MTPVSAFVTTYNNEATLEACLDSLRWASEIVLLDSFSKDRTLEIARAMGCRIFQEPFKGYGPQKQSALEKTAHPWVLLMDADEVLTPELQAELRGFMERGPQEGVAGYEIARVEQAFWRMSSPRVRLNHYLRLFDKRLGHVTDMPIHAAPEVKGPTLRLRHPFLHFGETSIHVKVDKINHYSTGLVEDKLRKGKRAPGLLTLLLYPPFTFLRQYLLKRQFLNGMSGLINAVVMAFYAFLKYAKLYEHHQRQRFGDSLLPPEAPSRRRSSVLNPPQPDRVDTKPGADEPRDTMSP